MNKWMNEENRGWKMRGDDRKGWDERGKQWIWLSSSLFLNIKHLNQFRYVMLAQCTIVNCDATNELLK